MIKINEGHFEGERALFSTRGAVIENSVFENGESPLKESSDLLIKGCIFGWKYPLWYCDRVKVEDSTLLEGARSGIWYTNGIEITDSVIEAPKTFRRSSGITLRRVNMPKAQETLWHCKDIVLESVTASGDYFAFSASNITADGLVLNGNYGFDGAKNITVRNSKLISKDAFWNTENVVVENSLIIGEYLGWNSKNLTFVNCTIQSLQGMCYMQNAAFKNCRLVNTELAFEYSKVYADIVGSVKSVKNPLADSIISADGFGEIILDTEFSDPDRVKIITKGEAVK